MDPITATPLTNGSRIWVQVEMEDLNSAFFVHATQVDTMTWSWNQYDTVDMHQLLTEEYWGEEFGGLCSFDQLLAMVNRAFACRIAQGEDSGLTFVPMP